MKFILKFFGYTQLSILAFVLFINALLDLAGIFILFPYIKLVANPKYYIEKYHLMQYLNYIHVRTTHQFIIATGLFLIAFYTLKAISIYFLSQYQFKVAANLTYRLTETMYSLLLHCRYNAFQQFPASQLMGVVYNNPIHATICMSAVATIVNEAALLIMLLTVSVSISPLITFIALGTLAALWAGLHITVVRRTQIYGKQHSQIEDGKHKLAYATISAIKDIKVMGIEEHLLAENSNISKQFFTITWKFNLLSSLPKTTIEYFIIVSLCLGIMVVIDSKQDLTKLLPLIGVGIASMLRILPSFTKMIAAINSLRFYLPLINKISDFYLKTKSFEIKITDCLMPFQKSLEIKNLGFTYDQKIVLTDVSLSILKGQSVGIVGMSGSGKSTFLDLLAGIQEKGEGEFLLDGKVIDPFGTNVIRRMLGYVPQTIGLIDESIAFNVTFSRNWDSKKLRNSLKVANLIEFVDQQPDRERTLVGENGVRLSGGQRQRIGIARALYKDPEILIFDEATSAVDNITEHELTAEIKNLAGTKTLIIVAHRLSTIQHCNRIFVLDQGRIIGSGTYAELLTTNKLFQDLHRQQRNEKLDSETIVQELKEMEGF